MQVEQLFGQSVHVPEPSIKVPSAQSRQKSDELQARHIEEQVTQYPPET